MPAAAADQTDATPLHAYFTSRPVQQPITIDRRFRAAFPGIVSITLQLDAAAAETELVRDNSAWRMTYIGRRLISHDRRRLQTTHGRSCLISENFRIRLWNSANLHTRRDKPISFLHRSHNDIRGTLPTGSATDIRYFCSLCNWQRLMSTKRITKDSDELIKVTSIDH